MEIYVREGLCMRSLTPENAAEVFGAADKNRAYLRRWLPWVDGTDSPAVTENVIANWKKQAEAGTDHTFGIFRDGKYIGNIGLHDINRHNSSGMIGYWLAEDAQGGGVMTDCVRSLTDYGFNNLSLNRIYIHCAEKNTKSRAVPERLGFALEGVLQDGECLYGEYFDLCVYGMVKRNWI